MKVIIVGAGSTGTQLAKYLLQEEHIVSIIESNEEKARHASNRLDCLVIHETGNKVESLMEAEVSSADALICVTDSDEDNMIICGLAASLQRTSGLIKIARVRNADYMLQNQAAWKFEMEADASSDAASDAASMERKFLGIDCFIHPDVEAAKAVIITLSHGALGNILAFPGTPYELGSTTIKNGSTFDGLTLTDFHSFIRDEGIISMIERGHDCFLPAGSTVLHADDLIHIITRKENMDQVFRMAGRTETPLKRIGIVGGGHLGSLILEELLALKDKSAESDNLPRGIASFFKTFFQKNERQVTVIEQDYSVCKELAARFPEALVLNEDISDENFVAEERISDLDLIITATANQELNIIAAVYLKSHGVKRTIALVSGAGYKSIALQLGVDVAISLNSVVVDAILSRLRGTGIRDVHSMGDGSVNIIEIEIREDSPVVGKAITYFKLSTGGIIMLVIRGETAFIPQGDYVFMAADRVILITKSGSEPEIKKIFGTL
ncbi:MAG: NAD-binding protein [Treponema sp.]|nr:NAD-binding protein [Treponema sp.]